ncbi:hypothetical protein [Nocardia gipuzkoensis]
MAFHEPSGEFFVGSTRNGTVFRGRTRATHAETWLSGGTDGHTSTSGLITDNRARLYVGGGPTGRLWIYDIESGSLRTTLRTTPGGFLHDIAVAHDGIAYATDSLANIVYRITDTGGQWRIEPWLDLTDTPAPRIEGHNLNGILVDGQLLLAVHTMTGTLYRVHRESKEVIEVDLGNTRVFGGDGLALSGDRLYVVQGGLSRRNPAAQVSVLRLSSDRSRAELDCVIVVPGNLHPSTARLANDRLFSSTDSTTPDGPTADHSYRSPSRRSPPPPRLNSPQRPTAQPEPTTWQKTLLPSYPSTVGQSRSVGRLSLLQEMRSAGSKRCPPKLRERVVRVAARVRDQDESE